MYRLSHRRQNSTEVLSGNLPAAYRTWYSFQGPLCRAEAPKYTLEHRTGRQSAHATAWSGSQNSRSPRNCQENSHPDLPPVAPREVQCDFVFSCCLPQSSKQGRHPKLGYWINDIAHQNPTSMGYSPSLQIRCQVPRDLGGSGSRE